MIESIVRRVETKGDGAATVYPFAWLIFSENDLTVTLIDNDGVPTVQTITTHYIVQGIGAIEGTVIMVTPPAADEYLLIERARDRKQLTDFRNHGSFTAQAVENALDKLVSMIQHVEDIADDTNMAEFTTATRPDVVSTPALGRIWSKRRIALRNATGPTVIQRCMEGATPNTWNWITVTTGDPF